MKKLLIPVLLTVSTSLMTTIGCKKSFNGIKINVDQDITEEGLARVKSETFTIDVTKKYRFYIDCSSLNPISWKDFGSFQFRDKDGQHIALQYEATYVELDGKELHEISPYSPETKGYIYNTYDESKYIVFMWPGHTLNKQSKMIFDIQFHTSGEIYALWYNET